MATIQRKNMRNRDESAWTAGFMAGGIFAEQCPYGCGTFEALDWYGGWIEGAATALDRDHSTPRDARAEAGIEHDSRGIHTARH
jgi:ribosome modulation factor